MASQAAIQAMLSKRTSVVFLECITVTHPDLSEPLLFVNDNQDLVRTAGTFKKHNFEVQGINQQEDQLPTMRIRICNVDQRVITAVRPLAGTRDDITFTYEVVLDSTPNVIEYGPIDFRVEDVAVTLTTLEFNLAFHSGLLDAAFPNLQFAPSNAG